MKKLIALLLSLAMVACLFAGCAGDGETPSTEGADTQATTTDAPNTTEGNNEPAATGSVYYLNFKPEADAAWQELAATYTAQTGVPVKVVTAASGKYSETLTAEMSKDSAPTLFQCGNLAGLETWQDYCLPLDGTAFLNEMTTEDFNLKKDGVTYCAGYCYEAYGIIVNTALLADAGYTVADITDFASLKAVAEDITARSEELGFSAFSSAGLDGSSSWRFSGHLANMPLYYQGVGADSATITSDYLDNFKAIWDLYINNSTCAPAEIGPKTGDESEAEFGTGKAVFFQNGTWEYNNLVNDETKAFFMNPEDLTMIPIYCGVEGEENSALCCGTENCWAVNAKASAEDQQATLDFLYWVVTSDEGTKMMAEQFGPIPFKNAKESENVFFNAANALFAEGKYNVAWAFNYTPNVDSWRQGVVDALMAYSTAGGSWDDVVTAFVDGWATEWELQNG
ncbi:MAG: ABC transporter substrate-binding protein [Faecousia sp.]